MSILNCDTRLTIINCTGLPASFTFVPEGGTMRLQPIGSCHINADIHTSATTLTEWFQEWIQLVSYGPTYSRLTWCIPPEKEETVRFQTQGPMALELKWTDPSISWAKEIPGEWSVDISNATDVTLFVRSDIGEYIKQAARNRPATVRSVKLKPYLELACDEEIPFCITATPIANMFWRDGINIQAIVSPQIE